MRRVLFDESLPALLSTAAEVLGQESLASIIVLREAIGRLSLLFDGNLEEEKKARLSSLLEERLGDYARREFLVIDRSEDLALPLFEEPPQQWIQFQGMDVRLIDRRIVGRDWLGQLAPKASPPRFVFSSLKGGVGRTTALCVAALSLARANQNVLVVDLDLEAPGAGALMLRKEDLPRLGMVDFLAEMTLSESVDERIGDFVAACYWVGEESGRLDVAPAFGKTSLESPEYFLGKLSRAMLDVGPSGDMTLSSKIARFLELLTAGKGYDVVLLDARAGLAELSAGPLLHLGATVLLFGNSHQQTIDGYRFLFAHMASLIEPGSGSPWDILRVVQAKTSSKEKQRWFREEMHALFQEYLYEELAGEEILGFNFDVDDPAGPHFPIPIVLNPAFADWSPRDAEIAEEAYESTFGPFLKALDRLVEQSHEPG